ncbi:unnamed protein product [Nippostrongylus brasiliensis]|uniref:SCP domain-containing protein n=1 Tax=Nippostrongylus brasiliensis TaxID=27835 RepID=A0A0N4YT45_NIPBR|nr:unnamed protein product [Nippostrongylus brasiliensis]
MCNADLPVYDCNLEVSAQGHANLCKFQHSNVPYGENLFYAPMFFDKYQAVDTASRMWFDELKKFGVGPENMLKNWSVGHYTQMVWGWTEKLGCGVKECPDGSVLLVCQYDPALVSCGQFFDDFDSNAKDVQMKMMFDNPKRIERETAIVQTTRVMAMSSAAKTFQEAIKGKELTRPCMQLPYGRGERSYMPVDSPRGAATSYQDKKKNSKWTVKAGT